MLRYALLLLCLWVPSLAYADDARWERADLHGDARVRFDFVPDFGVDSAATPHDRTWWLSSRLIVGADFEPRDGLELAFELEALNGQFAGPVTSVGSVGLDEPFRVARHDRKAMEWILPRKASVSLVRPTGRFSFGLQTFEWGTGMLSNDGVGDATFGDPRQGGVVARVGGTLTPWRPNEEAGAARGLIFVLAGDFVLRDDNAHAFRGDLAFQGVGAVLWKTGRSALGVFATARYQIDREDPYHPAEARPTAFAVPVDLFGRVRVTPDEAPVQLSVEGEFALVNGTTTRGYGEATYDGARIASHGGLLRAKLDVEPIGLTGQVEIGYASGDADPRDDVARTFTMNSDHEVGLLLFEHVLPLTQAGAADRAADPDLTGTPAAGLRHAVGQGGVHNAVYLYPTARWQPVGTLEVRAGALLAWAAAPPGDLYESARKGGYPTGWDTEPAEAGLYGVEALGAAAYTFELPADVGLTFGAEGGVLVPGAVLDGLDLGVLGTVRGRFDLTW